MFSFENDINVLWGKTFRRLLPRYSILTGFIITIVATVYTLFFDFYFAICGIFTYYVIFNIIRGLLIFRIDYLVSVDKGYCTMQSFLWSKWNDNPRSKMFYFLRSPGYDCRISQLKRTHKRHKAKEVLNI